MLRRRNRGFHDKRRVETGTARHARGEVRTEEKEEERR